MPDILFWILCAGVAVFIPEMWEDFKEMCK